MNITICGSISNAKKINETKRQLESLGHYVYSHDLMQRYEYDTALLDQINTNHPSVKKEYDTFKWYYNAIKESEAILVCNYDKNNIANYIGGSVLMEVGYAHVLDKKIYFLNPIPEVSFKDELTAASPIIINNDLSQII